MTTARAVEFTASAFLLVMAVGCSRPTVSVPASPQAARLNRSYIDLEPGMSVQIIVPLTKSGDGRVSFVAETNGNTISGIAKDLIGYSTSNYTVTGKPDRARLQFISRQESRNGKTSEVGDPAQLPFRLPEKPAHIRLVFLVRVSESDHNMAILASKRLDALDTFTKRLMGDPETCKSEGEVSCSWVPTGVAVRAEPPGTGKQ